MPTEDKKLFFQENGLDQVKSEYDTALSYLKDGKFDGIAFYENNTQDIDSNGKDKVTPAWMVFEPNQIKLAKNNSIYSLQSDDIRMKKGGKL